MAETKIIARMTQGVNRSVFVDSALFECKMKSSLHSASTQRLVHPHHGGKQPGPVTMCTPKATQPCQDSIGQGHIAVSVAFALQDVQHFSRPIDLSHLQLCPFLQAQPARVDRTQTNPIPLMSNTRQDLADFFKAQHNGKFVLLCWPHQLQGVPGALQGLFVEKFDAAQGDPKCTIRDTSSAFQVEKVLPKFFLDDPVW
jgi:hypothetical protein